MPVPPTRETILVVHGTFADHSPEAAPAWYAPGGLFCTALDAELAARGSSARCWAHLRPGEGYFRWDGANDWMSRLKAGAGLREQIQRLHADGWRVNLVAHSHGGNVVLNAIADQRQEVEPRVVGRVALLGTPIYQGARADVRRRERARRWRVVSVVVWAIVLYVSARHLDFAAAFQVGGPAEGWAMAAAVLLFTVMAVLVGRTSRRVQDWFALPLPSKGKTRWSPPFLLINSEYDEAYRSLAGLPNAPNPLLRDTPSRSTPASATAAAEPRPQTPSPRAADRFTSPVRAVTDAVRTRTATRITSTLDTPRAAPPLLIGFFMVIMLLSWQATSERIGSVPLPAAWAPVAFLGVLVVVVAAACVSTGALLFPAMGILETLDAIGRGTASLALLTLDGPIRRFVWDMMKSLSLGLNGAAEGVDDIAVNRELTGQDYVYLELPADIVAAVRDQQTTHGTTIHALVYRPGLIWSPLSLVKELTSIDFPLVHSAYYSNAECIQKIADWMCEPLVQAFDGHITHLTTQAVGAPYDGFQNMVGGEIEGPNHYVDHVNDLREKYGPLNTRWGAGTRLIGLRALQRSVSDKRTPPSARSSFDGRPQSPWQPGTPSDRDP